MMSIDTASIVMVNFVRVSVLALEMAGAVTILVGAVVATAVLAHSYWQRRGDDVLRSYRANLGRSILLGLEFLVAGDILKSLVIDPTLDDLVVLAGLILVRTFLSIALGVEINGHWPWQDTRLKREHQMNSRPA